MICIIDWLNETWLSLYSLPSRHTTLFQCRYGVVQCRMTSYRRWNDVVCLPGFFEKPIEQKCRKDVRHHSYGNPKFCGELSKLTNYLGVENSCPTELEMHNTLMFRNAQKFRHCVKSVQIRSFSPEKYGLEKSLISTLFTQWGYWIFVLKHSIHVEEFYSKYSFEGDTLGLSHLFLMHPFPNPWKQKTVRFSDVFMG